MNPVPPVTNAFKLPLPFYAWRRINKMQSELKVTVAVNLRSVRKKLVQSF